VNPFNIYTLYIHIIVIKCVKLHNFAKNGQKIAKISIKSTQKLTFLMIADCGNSFNLKMLERRLKPNTD